MGNTFNSTSQYSNSKPAKSSDSDRQAFSSQFSLSHFVGNLSGRSFISVTSNQSTYSASRPWSRVSRRRWNESTLKNPLEATKTAWPVANKESIFLPEFPITTRLQQKDFEITHTIANGAFGKVCKVKRLSDQKAYALKVLCKAQVVSESAVRQVKEESRIQEACGHHLFIVGAVTRWQTKKRLYIVLEYIPGGELLALIDKYKKLPEEVVKIFVAEIAAAIDFLHNAGVIYRDLKPENILLTADYHIQLIDFGLSKWLSMGSRTTTLCGTLKYMAPEVLSREPYGHAVDWWSLGVIACRMLTGEFPTPAANAFSDADSDITGVDDSKKTTNEDLLSHIDAGTSHVAPSPGNLPATATALSGGARAVLMRLLEREPRQRLRTLRQLQQTALYMGFNFDQVNEMKVSPLAVLRQHFPGTPVDDQTFTEHEFFNFDQATIV